MTKVQGGTLVVLFISFVCLMFGGLFCFVTVSSWNTSSEFRETAVKTNAVITNIESYTYRNHMNETERKHDVYVAYDVDGVKYEQQIGYYDATLAEGDTLVIYYDPKNPTRMEMADKIQFTFPAFMGLLFGTVGIVLIGSTIKQIVRRNNLLQNGTRERGVITAIETVTTVTVNGRHPYCAVVELTDTITGEKRYYTSDSVMEDINYMFGATVDVYVDTKGAYVDLASVEVDRNALRS